MGPRHINIMSTTLRILLQVVALCLAASLAQGSPLTHPPQSRQLQPWLEQDASLQAKLDLHTKGPDDSCHLFVATEPDALDEDAVLATGGNGVAFAVQSSEGDDDGVAITGLGFHVDQQTLAFFEEIGIDYEVYVLSVDGGPFLGNRARGNMAMWTKIAEGQIHTDDLTQSPTGYPEFSFYQIPPGSFRASVPPNGGVRSFLIQTRLGTGQNQLGTLLSVHPPEGKSLNDAMPMKIANVDEAGNSFPRVLLGEQFGGYPMPQDPFAYERCLFMGVLYYETECPTSFTGLSLTLISPPAPSGDGTVISFETTPAPVDADNDGGGDTVGFDAEGSDGDCHLDVVTDLDEVDDLVGGSGIVFAVQSNDGDDDGAMITGLAFYMDPLGVADFDDGISPGVVDFELYVLSIDGHYASPERNATHPEMISADAADSFDYRGDREMWTRIAEGQITPADLTQNFRGVKQYILPSGTFRASVPPNGGIRSFYIHTARRRQPSLVSARPPEWRTVNDVVDTLPYAPAETPVPRILVGEEFVFGYPLGVFEFMPDDPTFYQPSMFVGTLFYEVECPNGAPSVALSPSVAPPTTSSPESNLTPSFVDNDPAADVRGPDGFCHLYAATNLYGISGSPIGGSGILLPIRSDEDDDNGVVITGIGFHIDPAFYESDFFEKVDYEVYVLSVDGYYASPERNTANSGMISTDTADPYDYRGEQNIAMWTKIAEGEISLEDLTQDLIVGSLPARSDSTFYSLPRGAFRVHIPPNGGVRSFYIQTSPAGLLYANPRVGKGLNDWMDMYASHPGPGQHHPLMLVGEGFVGQSLPGGRVGMPDGPSLYSPKVFLGRVYYEWVHDEWHCSAALSPTSSPWTNLIPTYVDYHDDYFFTMSGDDDDDDDYTVRYHAREPDGSCHLHQATHPDTPDPKRSDGILFSIESDAHDKDGLMITGLGFYVGPEFVTASSEIIDYEIYTLSVDGYYASPERDATNPEMISSNAEDPFDYRGEENLDMWTKIAEGQITSVNLTQGYAFDEPNLYLLQPGSFRVSVPSGGIRSFYLQLKSAGGYDSMLVYSGPTGWGLGLGFAGEAVNDRLDMRIDAWPGPGHYSPYLRFGEAFVGKSMPDDPSAYTPGLFVGSFWYETLCPTSPHLPQSLEGGLLLSISMKCNKGDGLEDLSEETRLAVVEAVESAAERAVAESNPYLISNIAAELLAAHCVVGGSTQRQLSGIADQTVVQGDVMEFSVLIAADYVPPKPRPGEAAPPHEAPDLGAMTETHINGDPELFARDLNDRAAEASPLAEVEASNMQVQSIVVVEDEPLPERFTKAPTPTPGIAQALSAAGDGDDVTNVVGIVVGVSCAVAVALLLLGVYLFYAKKKPNPDKAVPAVLATCEIESGNLSDDDSRPPVLSEVKRDEARETRPVPVEGDKAKSERKSDEEEGIIVGAPSTVNVDDAEGSNPRDSAQSRFEGRLMQKLSSSAGGSSAEQSTNASGTSLGGSIPEDVSDDVEAEEGDVDDRDSAQSRFEDRLMRKMSSSAERRSAVPDRSPRPASLSGSASAEQRETPTGSRDAASFGGSASAEQRGTSAGSLGGEELNRDPQNESFSRFERRLRRKLTGSAGGAAKVSPASLDTDSESSEKNSATPENIGATDDVREEPQDAAFSRFERRLRRKVNA
ncbi:hypothetical protein ACHAXT_001318 [Thalassiosira profunda]